MFNLFDKVRIKLNGLIGTIVDISTVKGKKVYIVESDAPNTEGGCMIVYFPKLKMCNTMNNF